MYFQTISNVPKLAHNDHKDTIANAGMLTLLNRFHYVTRTAPVEGVKCPSLHTGFFADFLVWTHFAHFNTQNILVFGTKEICSTENICLADVTEEVHRLQEAAEAVHMLTRCLINVADVLAASI